MSEQASEPEVALEAVSHAAENKCNLRYDSDLACAACARGPSPNTENDIFVFREACNASSVPAKSTSSGSTLCYRS